MRRMLACIVSRSALRIDGSESATRMLERPQSRNARIHASGQGGITVADGGDADRIVIPEQLGQAALLVLRGRVCRSFDGALTKRAKVRTKPRWFAGRGVFLHQPRPARRHDEVPVDVVQLQPRRVEHGVGPSGKEDGVSGRHAVQFGPGRDNVARAVA